MWFQRPPAPAFPVSLCECRPAGVLCLPAGSSGRSRFSPLHVFAWGLLRSPSGREGRSPGAERSRLSAGGRLYSWRPCSGRRTSPARPGQGWHGGASFPFLPFPAVADPCNRAAICYTPGHLGVD